MTHNEDEAGPQGNLEAINDRPSKVLPTAAPARPRCVPEWDVDEQRILCSLHGSYWTDDRRCLTWVVLNEVAEHRQFQFENFGANRDLLNGTGPDVRWVPGDERTAYQLEDACRSDWDWDVDPDPAQMTWLRLFREEVAEAFKEDNDQWLEGELIQVAALAVSWVEKIKERRAP